MQLAQDRGDADREFDPFCQVGVVRSHVLGQRDAARVLEHQMNGVGVRRELVGPNHALDRQSGQDVELVSQV